MVKYKHKHKSINNLSDLIGEVVLIYAFDDNNTVIGNFLAIVSDVYLEDWYFYEKWNESIYVVVKLNQIENNDYYDNLAKNGVLDDEWWELFDNDYNLHDISAIVELEK